MTVTKLDFSARLTSALEANDLSQFVSDDIFSKLYDLTKRMLEVNEHMNLTAITDIDAVILKHYVDSLTVSKYISGGCSVIDVGCGAGFPSLILAIARPDLKITALDSTAKRINYIRETAELLRLENITCIAARAEELAHNADHRESYDIACARAVARLNVLSELCIPFVKTGGKFIAMKANADDELDESREALKKLGGKLISADKFNLNSPASAEDNPRCIISVGKCNRTPDNYPRNNSQIKKKPL